jgi:hypothetical protein
MSIVPEKIIQQVLIKGFQAFKDNNDHVDALFKNLIIEERERIKEFINTQIVEIDFNYPNRDVSTPCVVLILKGEDESEAMIGDLLQDYKTVEQGEHTPHMIDSMLGESTEIGRGTVGPIWGKGKVVLEPITAVGGGADYVDIPAGTVTTIDPFENTVFLEVLEGTGEGQRIEVQSINPRNANLPTRIVVISDFDTTLDDTSIVQISEIDDDEGSTGDAAKIFETTDRVERLGTIYSVNYQLIMLTEDQDHLLWMYTMVKAMMLINKSFMISQGFMNLKLGGSDFLPRREMEPHLVYQRSMNMIFQYCFDLYAPVTEPEINSFVLSLTVNDPDPTELGIEIEVSNTTVDIT